MKAINSDVVSTMESSVDTNETSTVPLPPMMPGDYEEPQEFEEEDYEEEEPEEEEYE